MSLKQVHHLVVSKQLLRVLRVPVTCPVIHHLSACVHPVSISLLVISHIPSQPQPLLPFASRSFLAKLFHKPGWHFRTVPLPLWHLYGYKSKHQHIWNIRNLSRGTWGGYSCSLKQQAVELLLKTPNSKQLLTLWSQSSAVFNYIKISSSASQNCLHLHV